MSRLIELATQSDVKAVQRCVDEAYEFSVERIGNKPAPMLDDYGHLITQQRVWLAFIDTEMAGLIVLWAKDDHMYVDNIAVTPSMQGNGVGSMLLDHAEALAWEHCLTEIRLYTNETMTENMAYYPRRGFVETHRAEQNGYNRIFYSRTVQAIDGGDR